MAEHREICESCRFWRGTRPGAGDLAAREKLAVMAANRAAPDDDPADDADIEAALESLKSWKDGQCRRHPPAVVSDPDDPMLYRDRWPVTLADDWCGEWRASGVSPAEPGAIVVAGDTQSERRGCFHEIVDRAVRRRLDAMTWPKGPARWKVYRRLFYNVGRVADVWVEYHAEPPADAAPAVRAVNAVDILAVARSLTAAFQQGFKPGMYLAAFIAANSTPQPADQHQARGTPAHRGE